MSQLTGKIVTILNVQKDGSLNVQSETGQAWRVNGISALRETDLEPLSEEVEFRPGDIIKVKMPQNIRQLLMNDGIPTEFIEYLRLFGVVGDTDENYQPFVRFGNWRFTQFRNKLLRKPTQAQRTKYQGILHQVNSLKPGDTVHLDVGPPNLIRILLKSLDITDQQILNAFTNSAKLIGFCDLKYAVIEYDNGQKFRVKRNHLTVPERFYIDEGSAETKGVDLKISNEIFELVRDSIQDMESKDLVAKGSTVQVASLSSGTPPTIQLKVNTTETTEKFQEELILSIQNRTTWTVENTCLGNIRIRGQFGKVALIILYNGEEEMTHAERENIDISKVTGETTTQDVSQKSKAEPISEEIDPQSLRGIPPRYFRLFDPNLGQDIYFPYIVHGPRRAPEPYTGNQSNPANVYQYNTTYNIADSAIGRISHGQQ